MKIIVATIIGTAVSLAAYAQPTPDLVARGLGEMEWHASVCHLATAPLEAALERYIKRIQAGSLEADHLRQEMVAGRAEYEKDLGRHVNCNGADSEVADAIAKTDQYGLH